LRYTALSLAPEADHFIGALAVHPSVFLNFAKLR
jgi:hypothetical protein